MNNNITFQEILSQYIIDRLPADDTVKHFYFVIKKYQEDMKITYFSDTTKQDLNNWKVNLVNRASRETSNNYLRHLKVLYSFAYDEEIIQDNPFNRFKMVRVFEQQYKSITTEDINIAIQYLLSNKNTLEPGWFWVSVIKTLYYTGMRRKQLIMLKWKHINFDKKTITLHSLGSKNRRSWDIPLHPSIYNDLQHLRGRFLRTYKSAELTNSQVFNVTSFNSKYHGNELKRSQLSGFFRNLSSKVNIKCSTHRFRHRIATDLVNSHPNIKEVQHLLGHSDIKTTLTYVEKNMDNLRSSLDNVPPIGT